VVPGCLTVVPVWLIVGRRVEPRRARV